MTSIASAQEVWAELLVDALVASGVTHVVQSPGSRSTPLVLALAARTDVQVIEVIDERAAGFVALGIGRATGRPAALLCTSGSAPTHYFPALVEADAAGVPLVVLTTNRPFALQRSGESQTIDQTKLFGDRVRLFADLGEPSPKELDLRAMRRLVAQAVFASRAPQPGPVHLDARFVKPLEPVLEPSPADMAHRASADELRARGVPRFFDSDRRVARGAVEALASRVKHASRPVLVAGPMPARADFAASVRSLHEATGIPVFADATSNVRFSDGSAPYLGVLDALYRSPEARRALAPDLVLQVGRTPVATGFAKLATEHPIDIALLGDGSFLDPHARASLVLHGDPANTLLELAAVLGGQLVGDARFRANLAAIEADARESVRDLAMDASGSATEPAAVRALASALPADARLVLGNSLSVRTVDGWVSPGQARVEVDSQRGASGIDGLVAGFVGATLATAKPSALLLGDVSLAHDLGSLALLRRLEVPAVVMVIDNGGGRIFEQLPIAARMPEAMTRFTTPPEIDFAVVGAALGLRATRIDRDAALVDALARAFATPGATLIHVVVPNDDATRRNAALFRAVDASVRRRLAR